MKNSTQLYLTKIVEHYQKAEEDRILNIMNLQTQLNNLYLSNKITAIDYTKLEKLISSGDTENINMAQAIINAKS
jgi:hypothetical protein